MTWFVAIPISIVIGVTVSVSINWLYDKVVKK